MIKLKKFDKVEVLWIDSIHESGWTREGIYDDNDKWLEHGTAGYFLKYTPKAIHIIQSKSVNDGVKGHSIDAIMQIPKVAITKVKKLK